MKKTVRKSSEERHQAIIDAIKTVFAEKGFEKTTTKELARVAGVSEALLYKHFPSKEAMYAAIHEDFIKNKESDELDIIMDMEPSTPTLVLLVQSMISHFFKTRRNEKVDIPLIHLLMTRSLLEDGDFARLAFKQLAKQWNSKFEECLEAADKAGDLRASPVRADLRGWFAHHIAIGMAMHLHPKVPAVNYKMSKAKLVDQAVWFILQGIGLKDSAIKRYYKPDALSKLKG
jgi:AcrR family transcriptional regulator